MDNRGHQYQVANDYEEIDLRELILEIWSHKWLICLITLAFILVAAVYSYLIADPVYQANTTFELSNLKGYYSEPANIARYLKSNTLLLPVIEESGYDYDEAKLQRYLADFLSVNSSNNSRIIDVSLKNKEPEIAKELLKVIVNALQENANHEYRMQTEKLQRDMANVEEELENIEQKIAEINREIDRINASKLEATEKSVMTVSLLNNLNIYVQEKNRLQTEKSKLEEKLLNYQPFRFLNEPYVQDSPVAPRKLFNLAIAGVLGVFVALFYVFMKNYFFDEKAGLKKA